MKVSLEVFLALISAPQLIRYSRKEKLARPAAAAWCSTPLPNISTSFVDFRLEFLTQRRASSSAPENPQVSQLRRSIFRRSKEQQGLVDKDVASQTGQSSPLSSAHLCCVVFCCTVLLSSVKNEGAADRMSDIRDDEFNPTKAAGRSAPRITA